MYTPFRLLLTAFLVALLTACGGDGSNSPSNSVPAADAGPDQDAVAGTTVTLDASGSADADDDALSFQWIQSSGPEVQLTQPGDQPWLAMFEAPAAPCGDVMTFAVTVSDDEDQATDSVDIRVSDDSIPIAELDGGILGKHLTVTVTFDAAMDPDSLQLGGNVADESGITWCNDRMLALSPKTGSSGWHSGSGRSLTIDARETTGNPVTTVRGEWLVRLAFENFQEASIVVGETAMDASEQATNAHQTGGALFGSARVIDGKLFIGDYVGSRVLGFNNLPTVNGAAASFILGQTDIDHETPGTSQVKLWGAQGVSGHDGKLVVTEYNNNRVAIYDPVPTSGPGNIDVVVGQAGFDTRERGCSATLFSDPEDSFVTPDGKLLVADRFNNRVLIWNRLPTSNGASANLVLGQQNFDHCGDNDQDGDGIYDHSAADTMNGPTGVWSDGEKLIVLDSDNFRVLLWNSFPTSNGQPADLVLGQPHMETTTPPWEATASNFGHPYIGVESNGEQIFITDAGFHRLLIWNSWPNENQQAADIVLGQANMTLKTPMNADGDDDTLDPWPSASTLWEPAGVSIHEDKLLVTDGAIGRVLIFESR